MLPVSGAEQLNTSGAQATRPMISHSGAYSRLVRPAPRFDSGRNRFHSSCGARLCLELLDHGDGLPAVACGHLFLVALLVGIDVLSMKAPTRFCSAFTLGEYSKSMAATSCRIQLDHGRRPD